MQLAIVQIRFLRIKRCCLGVEIGAQASANLTLSVDGDAPILGETKIIRVDDSRVLVPIHVATNECVGRRHEDD